MSSSAEETEAAMKSYPKICTLKENYVSDNTTKERHQF
jgi:hypothetical protein